jgi:peptidoglycan/xylan/chitin deacetylase (PgdA/CDA1 family)
MKSKYLNILAYLFIFLLFTLVTLKYFDTPRNALLEQVGIKESKLESSTNKYDVTQYLTTKSIKQDYSNYELSQNLIPQPNTHSTTNTLTILNYHGLTPIENHTDDLYYENFKEQLFTLKKAGYNTISIDDLYLFLRGEKELPDKSFMITFDDGRKDSYYFADPILESLNYTAVMFVVAKYSIENTNNYYLNYYELIQMQNSKRWELQSHSYSGHTTIQIDENGTRDSFFGNKAYLASKNRLETDEEYEDRIRIDLLRSKHLLEQKLGVEIHSFAIPFSDFGQHESNYDQADETSKAVYQDIYKMVFYQYKPLKNKDYKSNYNNKNQDFYFVMRNTVYPETTPHNLLKEIEATQQINPPYSEDFTNEYRWLTNWGNIKIDNNQLTLLNNKDSRTTLTYLDGSYLLEDYEYEIKINETSNQSISLVFRFENALNYASFTLRGNIAIMENLIDNQRTFSYKKVIPQEIDYSKNATIKITVQNNEAKAYINDILVHNAIFDMPQNGGVGFRSSLHSTTQQASTTISKISIKPIGEEKNEN